MYRAISLMRSLFANGIICFAIILFQRLKKGT